MNNQLLEQIQNTIRESVKDSKIGIAFSGGVDSTLIAKVCQNMGYDVTLLTIGFHNSHDILFAQEVNEFLQLPHEIMEIDPTTFAEVSSKINKIINSENLSWNENSIAFFYVSKIAHDIGLTSVVTANGIDELFCGYNAYRSVFSEGESKILELMNLKIENELKMMKAVNMVASNFGVKIIQPLLSSNFIEYAKSIPIPSKILGSDDLIRKHVIRDLARDIGSPKLSVNKRKKALQYGSSIHKAFLKSK